ncbi:MAG: Nramp family divalent metal transporter, partial [Planctomycetes bacterium]|nr:Nramp family divalent metal transporter [Planctomycetota bacterium]
MNDKRRGILAMLGPGILVAATGVGAGDLATGALTGEKLGVAVLWAVVLGAGLKYLLNEGLARWQLATGDTLLEGAARHLGAAAMWAFLAYLAVWSFLVGLALMSACGVTMHAIMPIGEAAEDKILYGILHSIVAVALVHWGGYRLFEKLMSVCIAVMFIVVIATALALRPAWSDVLGGLFVPTIPQMAGEGIQWTVALMGGIGGTVTVLCYGYWIREEGRTGADDLTACRVDLAAGYAMTAMFGVAMVVIGSRIDVEGGGSTLIVNLANQLHNAFGPTARWAFLAGAWGAVFSSLLGAWQSVPYIFADLCSLIAERSRMSADAATPRAAIDTASPAYRGFLYALATVPMIGL